MSPPTTASLLAAYRADLVEAFGHDVPSEVVDAVLLSGADALHRQGIDVSDSALAAAGIERTTLAIHQAGSQEPLYTVDVDDESPVYASPDELAEAAAARRARRDAELAELDGGPH